MSNERTHERPTSEGLWWMKRKGSVDGARVISFVPPNKYTTLGGDELYELPKDGYEYSIVESGSVGGSI